MPYIESQLQQRIRSSLKDMQETLSQLQDADEAKEKWLDEMSNIIAEEITYAINNAVVQAGITVSVDPNTGTGATNSTGTITNSV